MEGCIRSSVAKFQAIDRSWSDPLKTGEESFPVFFFSQAIWLLWVLDKLSSL